MQIHLKSILFPQLAMMFFSIICMPSLYAKTYVYTDSKCIEGACKYKVGKLQLDNGKVTYEGRFKSGRFYGEGIVSSNDGRQFHGNWKRGSLLDSAFYMDTKRNIKVSFVFEKKNPSDVIINSGNIIIDHGNGMKFSGVITPSKPITLKGTVSLPDGTSEVGSYVLLEVIDITKMKFPSLQDLIPNGELIAHKNGKLVSKGIFKNGYKVGWYYEVKDDGKDFLEYWQFGNMEYEGPGPLSLKTSEYSKCKVTKFGWYYKGVCKGNLASGKGFAYSPTGKVFIAGKFQAGEAKEGEWVKENFDSYQGSFTDWQYDGKGQLIEAGQIIYAGGFSAGKRHGAGQCLTNGGVQNCEFYQGKRMDQQYALNSSLLNRNKLMGDSFESFESVASDIDSMGSITSRALRESRSIEDDAREEESGIRQRAASNRAYNRAYAQLSDYNDRVEDQRRERFNERQAELDRQADEGVKRQREEVAERNREYQRQQNLRRQKEYQVARSRQTATVAPPKYRTTQRASSMSSRSNFSPQKPAFSSYNQQKAYESRYGKASGLVSNPQTTAKKKEKMQGVMNEYIDICWQGVSKINDSGKWYKCSTPAGKGLVSSSTLDGTSKSSEAVRMTSTISINDHGKSYNATVYYYGRGENHQGSLMGDDPARMHGLNLPLRKKYNCPMSQINSNPICRIEYYGSENGY